MAIHPTFAKFLPQLFAREGGAAYTNRAADRGGPTKYGWTAATLGRVRGLGRAATAAEVKALTEAEAGQLYSDEFFVRPGFALIAVHSERIAEELLDTAVNMGPDRPSRWMQRTLNACNNRGRHYPDVLVDGAVGRQTAEALKALIQRRGKAMAEDLVLKCLNGLQLADYFRITEAGGPNSDQEENLVGWVSQRIGF